MTEPKRTSFQREAHYVEITRRYLRGETQHEIAETLGVSQPQITYDLKKIKKRWVEQYIEDIQQSKLQELARVGQLERTYWVAWEDSKRLKETKSAEQSKKSKSEKSKSESEIKAVKQETRDGNPAFLEGVQWCIERRCKMLGVDAPERKELTGRDGGPLVTEDISGLSPEEREARIDELIARRKARRGDGTLPTAQGNRGLEAQK